MAIRMRWTRPAVDLEDLRRQRPLGVTRVLAAVGRG